MSTDNPRDVAPWLGALGLLFLLSFLSWFRSAIFWFLGVLFRVWLINTFLTMGIVILHVYVYIHFLVLPWNIAVSLLLFTGASIRLLIRERI